MGLEELQQPSIEIDNKTEQAVLQFMRTLSEKPDTTVRFFYRKQEYYTVHGKDAHFIAKDYFHTNAVIKYFGAGDKGIPYVCVSPMMFDSTLRSLLLVRQYRVEVYSKEGKGSNWELLKKGSPGNLQEFEDDLFAHTELSTSALVMAVKLASDNGQRVIGVAYGDATTKKLGVCEFPDNDQFSNLEALIVQLGAKECLLAPDASNPDYEKMARMVQRSGMMVTERKKADFTPKDIVQDLGRLLKGDTSSSALPQLDQKQAMSALTAIIKYLELLSDESNFHLYDLDSFDLSQFMKLDAAAVRALNLFPSPQDGSNKTMCLVGLLNKCKTAQGQRLISQWIKQPLLDINRIAERHDMVEAFCDDTQLRQCLQETHLKNIPDLYRLAKKFRRAKATLSDCMQLYKTVTRINAVAAALKEYEGPHAALMNELFIDPLTNLDNDFEKYREMIETTIDLDREDHDVLIKATFDEKLTEIHEDMEETLKAMDANLRKVKNDFGEKTVVRLESANHLGYYFRITRKDEKELRSQGKKYITLETQKNGVRFTSQTLKTLSEKYLGLKDQYHERQSSLEQEVVSIAAGYDTPMEALNDVLALLDVLVSFSVVSASAPTQYIRPKMMEMGTGDIRLIGARHPCLEVQDDVSFIANDVNLLRDKSNFHIITGPNMGGKSTYIRQVGVIVLMAQIGCFVPCTSATISITDKILARVGAGDSQLKGVSTFMAEMLETASILKSATPNSLIVIDELGRGTSTYDGFGLAWAISEYIATKVNAFCLFATHFHELTALADAVPTVSNLHVTAVTANNTLTLLYRVRPGFVDQSFGIHVAELANFPEKVVQTAKRKAAELEDFQVTDNGKGEENDSRKKMREDKEEGERLIKEFMDKVSALPLSSLSADEAFEKVQAMRCELEARGNAYVAHVQALA
eukprot:comp22389_c2_seq1/m.33400 comp22389_c2_seq1/g.33400  ORF comp22389_c2_seq1/g.33400 comp22389_c2_seq1/m.33400 type:complete len:920 (-) comp22389_c2_seq1:572-3331(-)